jgi:hypothetical protein
MIFYSAKRKKERGISFSSAATEFYSVRKKMLEIERTDDRECCNHAASKKDGEDAFFTVRRAERLKKTQVYDEDG